MGEMNKELLLLLEPKSWRTPHLAPDALIYRNSRDPSLTKRFPRAPSGQSKRSGNLQRTRSFADIWNKIDDARGPSGSKTSLGQKSQTSDTMEDEGLDLTEETKEEVVDASAPADGRLEIRHANVVLDNEQTNHKRLSGVIQVNGINRQVTLELDPEYRSIGADD